MLCCAFPCDPPGGFLQGLIFGYGGARLPDDRSLVFRAPRVPPNATELALRNLSFLNATLTLLINATHTCLEPGSSLASSQPPPTSLSSSSSLRKQPTAQLQGDPHVIVATDPASTAAPPLAYAVSPLPTPASGALDCPTEPTVPFAPLMERLVK